jgi:dCTP deaminase
MMLSDGDIIRRTDKARLDERGNTLEQLIIKPFNRELQLQPASVDLRLDKRFRLYDARNYFDCEGRTAEGKTDVADLEKSAQMDEVVIHECFSLYRGSFVLGTSLEWLEIPRDLVGRVEGRSSLGRLGLMIHATAGFIDPGFKGQITLELSNVSPNTIILYPGMRICQVSFQELKTPALVPYGTGPLGSSYQNQDGPVASRFKLDK